MRCALFVIALAARAATWTGTLVDDVCYERMERNVSPKDTLTDVDRDRDFEIRYCHPTAKTKSFALVDHDGQLWKLDASGESQAHELLQNQKIFSVTVNGEAEKKTIRVASMAPTR